MHHEAVVEPTDLVEMLPQLVHHYGEPFADSSMVPSFYLARWARQSITVALTGEGGDELFGGYYRHQAVRIAGYADVLPAAVKGLAGVRRDADRLRARPPDVDAPQAVPLPAVVRA